MSRRLSKSVSVLADQEWCTTQYGRPRPAAASTAENYVPVRRNPTCGGFRGAVSRRFWCTPQYRYTLGVAEESSDCGDRGQRHGEKDTQGGAGLVSVLGDALKCLLHEKCRRRIPTSLTLLNEYEFNEPVATVASSYSRCPQRSGSSGSEPQ